MPDVLLRAGLEAALDPVRRLHALGRIDLLGRIALDVDDGELAALELRLAVGRLHDGLVPLADRHAHGAAWTFEGRALQRRAHLLVGGALAAVAVLRLLPRQLDAE